jgi:hypothetical protein
MNKNEAINEFVKQNIYALSSSKYEKNKIKNLKKQFFLDKYKNKFGVPRDKEIARILVDVFRKNGKIKSLPELESIISEKKVPFLSSNIHNVENLLPIFEEEKIESSILTPEDLSKLNQIDFLKKKEEELKERVIKEKSEDIDKALEEKRKKYDSFPSVLDAKDFEEPKREEDEENEIKEWWQTLGLTADPFPRQEGLDRIPPNIYDKVIYKSVLIQDYINRIENNRDKILNKGILVLGNFGTGKTAFFDYLSYYLIKNKICHLRMTFLPKVDVSSYIGEFETKLYSLLKAKYCEHHGDYHNGPANLENSKKIMLELKEQGWSFMIIIDDLHKHLGYEETVLRFLSSLQIVKDELIRSGINIGFIVAGIPSWELKMKQDSSLPGFFDTTPEIIPEVSPDGAYQVINNRLRAYSTNPLRVNIIDLEWIRQIHRKIKNDGHFVNYRILINEVIKELKNKNFNILESNYIDISEDTMSNIKLKLIELNVFKTFENLLNNQEIDLEENKVQCFNLIIKLFLNKGIRENDPYFIGSEFYFKKLLNSRIILKFKEDDTFKWALDPNIADTFNKIVEEYNLYPEDYLKKIFFIQEKVIKKIIKVELIEELEGFINEHEKTLDNSVVELIKCSLSLLKEYEQIHKEEIDNEKYKKNVNLLVTSLSCLTKAIFIIEGKKVFPLEEKNVLESWKDYWFYPNAIANLINEVWYNQAYPSREKLGYVYLNFNEAYNDLFDYLKETIFLNKCTNILIPYPKLKKDEIEILNKIRKDYHLSTDGKSYFDIVKDANNLVENKFKACFYNQLGLIYGDIKNRLNMLEGLKEYIIKKGVEYSNPFFNEFENLNRGEYKKLILENTKLKRQYFPFLFKDWDNNELDSFLDVFCDTNIIISHLKTQRVTSEDQAYIYRFLLNSIGTIHMLNGLYIKLLEDYFYFIIHPNNTIVSCYFSPPGIKSNNTEMIDHKLNSLDDKIKIQNIKDIAEINITLEEINLIYEKIKNYAGNGKKYLLDLEDFELIYNLFSIEYRKFMAILALLIYKNNYRNDGKLKFKILPNFGSEVILSLE